MMNKYYRAIDTLSNLIQTKGISRRLINEMAYEIHHIIETGHVDYEKIEQFKLSTR